MRGATVLSENRMSTDVAPAELPSVTVVVPTYREAPNLPLLLARLARVRAASKLDLDVVVVDDDSRDGLVEAVADSGYDWARVVVRRGRRGLSEAVVDGLPHCRGDALVVMDADLSHPPETIPVLLDGLARGRQAVVGSRYVAGGRTHDHWGVLRALNSRIAALLARPLTPLKDPMAGFFAVWRRDVMAAAPLRPLGYKILLEMIVKCELRDIAEVPIVFDNRRFGRSKLTVKQRMLYLAHLVRLYRHRFGAGR